MGRIVLLGFVLVLLAAGVGFLAMGAFPPSPHPTAVHKVLPNDRFAPKG